MPRQSNQWLIPVLLALGVAGALWYYRMQVSVPDVAAVPVPVETAPEPLNAPVPLHPMESPPPDTADSPVLMPLPALGDSDEYFKLELAMILGDSVDEKLAQSGLIEKLVATIDNLPRSQVAGRIRPLAPVDGTFVVDGQDASGEYAISSSNSERYDSLIALLESADLNVVMDLYRRFYPLFQSAYVQQGYPDGYFNDRLVEVIDHLLETPDISEPIALVRPHVLYEFEDAELEALSSGQKIILRMGDEHAAVVKDRLREMRELLTAI
ncbi:MAG: DUF3014 domain-containing protein [Woeseiaceae bacterium]